MVEPFARFGIDFDFSQSVHYPSQFRDHSTKRVERSKKLPNGIILNGR